MPMFLSVVDVNATKPTSKFDVIMANHSLHHIVELEKTFDTIFDCLNENGIFATCDMIGRNGHMRWPETEARSILPIT
jgi:trans-aconitate methyltransferase